MEPLRCWKDLVEVYEDLSANRECHWIFRGTKCARLETSLEQAAREFGIPAEKLPKVELGLTRQFARHFHHYALQIPEPGNYLEWFSIMRHYGAPTRLLDFTYSFYVALFFALESPRELDHDSGDYEAPLWAVESNTLEARLRSVLNHTRADVRQVWSQDPTIARYATFNALFMGEQPVPLVAVVSPYRRNERLTIQQGTFLCPGDIQRPFIENLQAVLPDNNAGAFQKLTIRLTQTDRSEILSRLNQMNMNHATLFPGLEGMARSLRLRLASDETLLFAPDLDNPLEP